MKKVTDISTLKDGDKVLINIWSYQLFRRFIGNPGNVDFTPESEEINHFTEDRRYLGLQDSNACEFTLIKGNDGYSDYYQFRGSSTLINNGNLLIGLEKDL